MNFRQRLAASPVLARVLPFLTFVILTFLQDRFGEPGRYWIYFLKTGVGAWMLWQVRPLIPEMQWTFNRSAISVGIGVFILWVALDPFYPKFGRHGLMWNPFSEFEVTPWMAWFFVIVRILGSTFVVPWLEEVFYRSFVYRWIIDANFQQVPFNRFDKRAFLLTAMIFGFSHHEWLAGILCGLAYQWLVLKNNRLNEAIAAHAITNLMLGLWVVLRSAWNFW